MLEKKNIYGDILKSNLLVLNGKKVFLFFKFMVSFKF